MRITNIDCTTRNIKEMVTHNKAVLNTFYHLQCCSTDSCKSTTGEIYGICTLNCYSCINKPIPLLTNMIILYICMSIICTWTKPCCICKSDAFKMNIFNHALIVFTALNCYQFSKHRHSDCHFIHNFPCPWHVIQFIRIYI